MVNMAADARDINPDGRFQRGFHHRVPSSSMAVVDGLGAGEGIRTLDPNLGKVVLYP
jgi:hypothetical protein